MSGKNCEIKHIWLSTELMGKVKRAIQIMESEGLIRVTHSHAVRQALELWANDVISGRLGLRRKE